MSSPLLVLRSFSTVFEARVAQSRLQAAGIPAFLPDAHVAGIDPLLTDALGGVRLQVRQQDLDEATALLDQPTPDAEQDPTDGDDPTCPRCESPYWSPRWSLAHKLGLVLTLGRGRRWWRQRPVCARCDLVFDAPTPPGRETYRQAGVTPPVRQHGNPVFWLRRTRALAGAVAGFVAGLFAAVLFGAGPGAGTTMVFGTLVGWFLGSYAVHGVCSAPSCRAPLRPDARRCPRCRGEVIGAVRSEAEHWIAKAEWHRTVPRSRSDRGDRGDRRGR